MGSDSDRLDLAGYLEMLDREVDRAILQEERDHRRNRGFYDGCIAGFAILLAGLLAIRAGGGDVARIVVVATGVIAALYRYRSAVSAVSAGAGLCAGLAGPVVLIHQSTSSSVATLGRTLGSSAVDAAVWLNAASPAVVAICAILMVLSAAEVLPKRTRHSFSVGLDRHRPESRAPSTRSQCPPTSHRCRTLPRRERPSGPCELRTEGTEPSTLEKAAANESGARVSHMLDGAPGTRSPQGRFAESSASERTSTQQKVLQPRTEAPSAECRDSGPWENERPFWEMPPEWLGGGGGER